VPTVRHVCVFCASSEEIDPRYAALAADVGRALADRRWTLVSGGGSVSMMGVLARTVRAHGGRTIGVIPEALVAWEVADRGADELVVTRDMRQRKGVMDERSDAFLALPGGIGTIEELVEVWTARALGMHAKPVVVLDPWDDLAPLRGLVDGLAGRGFVRPAAADVVVWTRTVEAAVAALAEGMDAPTPTGAAPADPRIHDGELLESDGG
jgi:uncharacterized protein (TIGR00730 family)